MNYVQLVPKKWNDAKVDVDQMEDFYKTGAEW